jgi:circadian clock protein KaiC
METAIDCEMTKSTGAQRRAATGIAGLDNVLAGGVTRNRLHLLEGSPGTGKTTIALNS